MAIDEKQSLVEERADFWGIQKGWDMSVVIDAKPDG